MIKLILFIKRIHFVLIFIVLEALALHYYANSTSFTKARLVTASNYVVGGMHSKISGIQDYFHLRKENEILTKKLTDLYNKFDSYSNIVQANDSSGIVMDSSYFAENGARHWEYYNARVINNSIIHQENYITLNKGALDGIQPDMAVIAGNSILGYVMGCSGRFSICMSILNREFRTGGKIKGSDYFGTIYWDGLSYEHVMLSEVPKYADVQKGDTIVTSSHSLRFPPDLMIGTVENFELKNATFYDIKVKLNVNMAAINNVIVAKNLDYGEINALEQSVVNPQSY